MPNKPQSAPRQDGEISDVQARDNALRDVNTDDEITAVKRVTSKEHGAKRSSFFKNRDYRA